MIITLSYLDFIHLIVHLEQSEMPVSNMLFQGEKRFMHIAALSRQLKTDFQSLKQTVLYLEMCPAIVTDG